jgi:hypothetical protein
MRALLTLIIGLAAVYCIVVAGTSFYHAVRPPPLAAYFWGGEYTAMQWIQGVIATLVGGALTIWTVLRVRAMKE